MLNRRKALPILTFCVLILLPLPVHADGTASGSSSNGNASAGASGSTGTVAGSASSGNAGSAPAETGGTSGGGSSDPCTYSDPQDLIAATAASQNAAAVAGIAKSIGDIAAEIYANQGTGGGVPTVASCPGESTGFLAYPGAGQPPPADVDALAVQATQSVTVTTPPVSFSPYWLLDDGRYATLKNAETWVWIDPANWTGHAPRVDAGPVWVEATITPIQIVITPGDGVTETKNCDGPGTAVGDGVPLSEPSPDCSVKFTQQTDGDTWPVTVQVVYSVTWVGFNGTSTVSGTLDNLISAPAPYPLAVLTSKTRLVDPNATD